MADWVLIISYKSFLAGPDTAIMADWVLTISYKSFLAGPDTKKKKEKFKQIISKKEKSSFILCFLCGCK